MHLVLLGHSILQQARKQVVMMKNFTVPFEIEDRRPDTGPPFFTPHKPRKPASLLNILQWAIFNDCFQACNNRASAAEVRRPQRLNLPQTHHNPTKHWAGGLRLTPT
jgi:hypothetical protein